jgi:NaMN:DMB phosphoribosyltransferase
LGQLSLFLIPVISAWTSTLTHTALIPLAAMPLTLCLGGVLLISRRWRRAGGRIIAGTVVAAALEVALTLLLIVAYSSAHPGWDLS